MNIENKILLYAKVGYFFAECDGIVREDAEDSIVTKIQNLINIYKKNGQLKISGEEL